MPPCEITCEEIFVRHPRRPSHLPRPCRHFAGVSPRLQPAIFDARRDCLNNFSSNAFANSNPRPLSKLLHKATRRPQHGARRLREVDDCAVGVRARDFAAASFFVTFRLEGLAACYYICLKMVNTINTNNKTSLVGITFGSHVESQTHPFLV